MNDYHGKTLLQPDPNPKAVLFSTVEKERRMLRQTVRHNCPKARMGEAVVVATDHGVSLGIYYEDPGEPGRLQYHNIAL